MMEQWKFTIIIGIILVILGIIYGMLRNDITNTWILILILLGIADIAIGFYRKIKEGK